MHDFILAKLCIAVVLIAWEFGKGFMQGFTAQTDQPPAEVASEPR